ncbi:epidermal retinol dehydrogenase 2-like [Haliotis asinina]|uniref:epidermal retinol dehydrogenase 2-like n=1 Tax=Haliotis asinina TaxID=109174 RepID=UPI0035324361
MVDVAAIFEMVLEVIVLIGKLLYFWLEAIVLAVLPASVRGKDISGETVLITGAGSGIGRLLAKRFADRGCRLVLWDINKEGNEETAAQVQRFGITVKTYTVDLSDAKQIYQTAEKVKRDMGDIDILVNNAGIVTGRKFMQCPDEMVQKTMQVNVQAHFWTVKAFLPSMLDRNHGHIVNIASSAGLLGVSGLADYCASKFAAVGFEESLRYELETSGKTGVHTTVVCPYLIDTGMFDGCESRFSFLLPKLKPDDVVDSIMDALLCNSAIVIIPKILYAFIALKGILPIKVAFLLCDFMGVNSMMTTFKGRGKAVQ